MNRQVMWILAATGVVAAAGVLWFVWQRPEPSPVVADAPAERASAPAIAHPLPDATEGQAALPALNDSDAPVRSWLVEQFGERDVAEFLVPEQIIRRIVATVDNLPRERLAMQLRPVRAIPGELRVAGTEAAPVLAAANYARYAPFTALVEKADVAVFADWYKRNYPLFQQAYRALGYPDGYFNDRLVQCIDNLLVTPELSEPPALIQPRVFYQFADPALESRSAGQKWLLRMGPDNTRIIKAKLQELRASIASRPQ